MPTISIHCDNQSTIGKAHNSMYNGKSQHMHQRNKTIRQSLSNGVISIYYIKSKDNPTD